MEREVLEATYIRCSFNKSGVKRKRDRTVDGRKVNSRKDCSFILEWEREGKGHREVEDARERKQREQSPRGQKGQGQEQVEILALDGG